MDSMRAQSGVACLPTPCRHPQNHLAVDNARCPAGGRRRAGRIDRDAPIAPTISRNSASSSSAASGALVWLWRCSYQRLCKRSTAAWATPSGTKTRRAAMHHLCSDRLGIKSPMGRLARWHWNNSSCNSNWPSGQTSHAGAQQLLRRGKRGGRRCLFREAGGGVSSAAVRTTRSCATYLP